MRQVAGLVLAERLCHEFCDRPRYAEIKDGEIAHHYPGKRKYAESVYAEPLYDERYREKTCEYRRQLAEKVQGRVAGK